VNATAAANEPRQVAWSGVFPPAPDMWGFTQEKPEVRNILLTMLASAQAQKTSHNRFKNNDKK